MIGEKIHKNTMLGYLCGWTGALAGGSIAGSGEFVGVIAAVAAGLFGLWVLPPASVIYSDYRAIVTTPPEDEVSADD